MEKKRSEIRDWNFERDTGFGDFTKWDSGNVILKSRDSGSTLTKMYETNLSSSWMSEIGQQNVSTIRSRGYFVTPMAILSVSVNLGRNNILWIRFTSDLLSTAKSRVSSY